MNNKLSFYFLLFYFLPQIVEKESGLTSLRIRAEKEKELQEAEAYWSKRFAKQEQEVRITITYIFNIMYFLQKDDIMLHFTLSGSSDNTGCQCLFSCLLSCLFFVYLDLNLDLNLNWILDLIWIWIVRFHWSLKKMSRFPLITWYWYQGVPFYWGAQIKIQGQPFIKIEQFRCNFKFEKKKSICDVLDDFL